MASSLLSTAAKGGTLPAFLLLSLRALVFLGLDLFGKGSLSSGDASDAKHVEIRGLNTAASVWLSAGVGMASGGGRVFSFDHGVYYDSNGPSTCWHDKQRFG